MNGKINSEAFAGDVRYAYFRKGTTKPGYIFIGKNGLWSRFRFQRNHNVPLAFRRSKPALSPEGRDYYDADNPARKSYPFANVGTKKEAKQNIPLKEPERTLEKISQKRTPRVFRKREAHVHRINIRVNLRDAISAMTLLTNQ